MNYTPEVPEIQMDPETLEHIIDVVNAVKTASRELPTDVQVGLLERRTAIRIAKMIPLSSDRHGRRSRLR